jgi:Thioredoxin like C-terminal domain
VVNYRGTGTYDAGSHDFAYPPSLPDDSFALRGRWSLDYQGGTAETPSSSIALNHRAKDVYLVVGGAGNVAGDVRRGHLDVDPDPGLQLFSFTYG